jgi:nitrate reductase gamma subunit
MSGNLILFVVFPYVAFVLAVVGTAYRLIYRPSTVSSLTTQLLEERKLFWGSISFHWGLMLILAGHLLALLVPRGLELWNGAPLRLYLLETTGLALGLWSLSGLAILAWRRLSEPRVQAVTRPMDVVIMLLLAVSMVTGVLTAVLYSFGSFWFTSVLTPYIWSLAALAPRPELVADLPLLVQIHLFNFFLLLAAFPFSRLVHAVTLPLGYLVRPWQLVIRQRSTAPAPLRSPGSVPAPQVRR